MPDEHPAAKKRAAEEKKWENKHPKKWTTKDLDFDSRGRLIIANASLSLWFQRKVMTARMAKLQDKCDGLIQGGCKGKVLPPNAGCDVVHKQSNQEVRILIRKKKKKGGLLIP